MAAIIKDVLAALEITQPSDAKPIIAMLPEIKPDTIRRYLVTLKQRGLVEQGPDKKYRVVKAVVTPKSWDTQRSPATPKPMQVTLDPDFLSLKAQVADLLAWKADAMARYPALRVPQVVLDARKIVAQTFADKGEPDSAAKVRDGQRDKSAIMVAVVAALESKEIL